MLALVLFLGGNDGNIRTSCALLSNLAFPLLTGNQKDGVYEVNIAYYTIKLTFVDDVCELSYSRALWDK